MPIYEYRCSSCGHEKEVLQKMSDAPLTVCPECGKSTFSKRISAAGFQLKGSGWYATDFRGGSKGADKKGDDKGEAKAGPDSQAESKPKDKPKEESKGDAPATGGPASSA
jgi:putative FmdB family regulatory protein